MLQFVADGLQQLPRCVPEDKARPLLGAIAKQLMDVAKGLGEQKAEEMAAQQAARQAEQQQQLLQAQQAQLRQQHELQASLRSGAATQLELQQLH
eukprot:5673818-Alexandrium_andersonii.AAC.1